MDLRIEIKADEASEEVAFDSLLVVAEPSQVLALELGSILLALATRIRPR